MPDLKDRSREKYLNIAKTSIAKAFSEDELLMTNAFIGDDAVNMRLTYYLGLTEIGTIQKSIPLDKNLEEFKAGVRHQITLMIEEKEESIKDYNKRCWGI